MSLGVLVVIVAFGVILVIGAVHFTGGSRQKDTRDHGDAILEFSRAYPGEAIRSVIMTADGKASFMRLASGKTGFLQAMGHHFVARLIEPQAVSVEALEDLSGLRVGFHDTTLKGGDYLFASTEDAAEVSLWLCGSLALASPKLEGPEEAGHA